MVIYQKQSHYVTVPVIKDKNRRVNEKGNYRPICLSNVCSKIIDAVLITNGYVLANYATSVWV